jgi:transglutaminase-like putative cysteine protease
VRVRTDDPNPSYLRLTALDEFTGSTWAPSQRDFPPINTVRGALPRPPGQAPGVRTKEVAYSIRGLAAFKSSRLPAPYPTSQIDVVGDWRYDADNLDVVSANPNMTTAGLQYSLLAEQVLPTKAQLEAAGQAPAVIREKYTDLPLDLPAVIGSDAAAVTVNATTDFEKAVALQDWFRDPKNGFTYSTRHVPGNGIDTMVSFLTNNRSGYCEQYAAAMALMARTLDIPARVAVGFLSPNRVRDTSNTYVYSAHDLHAWPELYFSGVGWVRFEPTPRAQTSTPPYTNGVVPTSGIPTTNPSATTTGIEEIPSRTPAPSSGPANPGRNPVASSTTWLWILPAFIIALALFGPALCRRVISRRRWSHATSPAAVAEAAWDDLRDAALDYSVGWPTTLTPRGTGRSLLAALGDDSRAAAALRPLVSLVERARYARSVEADDQVHRQVETLVTVMRERASRGRRLRVLFWPPSLLASAHSGWQRLWADLERGWSRRSEDQTSVQPLVTG